MIPRRVRLTFLGPTDLGLIRSFLDSLTSFTLLLSILLIKYIRKSTKMTTHMKAKIWRIHLPPAIVKIQIQPILLFIHPNLPKTITQPRARRRLSAKGRTLCRCYLPPNRTSETYLIRRSESNQSNAPSWMQQFCSQQPIIPNKLFSLVLR
jgi:hypothetical protein